MMHVHPHDPLADLLPFLIEDTSSTWQGYVLDRADSLGKTLSPKPTPPTTAPGCPAER